MIERLRQLEAEGNTRAVEHIRSRIVEANLPFVISCVNKLYRRGAFYHRLPMEDAVQVGAIALYRAVDKYDPEMGAMTTYARMWIEQAIRRARHSETIVHVPERRWHDLFIESLDAKLTDEEGNGPQLQETLADDSPNPEERFFEEEYGAVCHDVATMIYTLDRRQQEVLSSRFMRGLTLQEIGDSMELSREWVRRIESEALGELREEVERRYGKA